MRNRITHKAVQVVEVAPIESVVVIGGLSHHFDSHHGCTCYILRCSQNSSSFWTVFPFFLGAIISFVLVTRDYKSHGVATGCGHHTTRTLAGIRRTRQDFFYFSSASVSSDPSVKSFRKASGKQALPLYGHYEKSIF